MEEKKLYGAMAKNLDSLVSAIPGPQAPKDRMSSHKPVKEKKIDLVVPVKIKQVMNTKMKCVSLRILVSV